MLQTLGATAGAAGLAGCGGTGGGTSGGGSGGESSDVEGEDNPATESSTEESSKNIPDISPKDFAAAWTQVPEDGRVPVDISSFSPDQVKDITDQTKMHGLFAKSSYDDINYSPEDVPQTFIQYFSGPSTDVRSSSSVKVDQLSEDVTYDQVISSLEDEGYEQVEEQGEFSVYRNLSSDTVYGVGPGTVVMGTNYLNSNESATNSTHRADVISALEHRKEGEVDFTEDMKEAIGSLDVRDSLEVITNQERIDLVQAEEIYQPKVGASSVDLEEETKYGAWVFDDEEIAEEVYNYLSEGGTRSYGWERIDRDGRVVTAGGEARLNETLGTAAITGLSLPFI